MSNSNTKRRRAKKQGRRFQLVIQGKLTAYFINHAALAELRKELWRKDALRHRAEDDNPFTRGVCNE